MLWLLVEGTTGGVRNTLGIPATQMDMTPPLASLFIVNVRTYVCTVLLCFGSSPQLGSRLHQSCSIMDLQTDWCVLPMHHVGDKDSPRCVSIQ